MPPPAVRHVSLITGAGNLPGLDINFERNDANLDRNEIISLKNPRIPLKNDEILVKKEFPYMNRESLLS